ncbi:MAG: DUF721 domain-containing protein [Deltaproteobacteria bacterium]|nr:DUF721 domain-containing protein [Deltaproteobacteria bacterium]
MKRPKSIAAILGHDPTPALAVLELSRLWPQVVGPVVAPLAAERCRPVAFRQGLLTVAADSPAWAQELDLRQVEIQARLDEILGPGLVTGLRFKTASARRRPQKPKPTQPPAPALAPPPPDPALKARLEEELSGIDDPELKETLFRLRLKAARPEAGPSPATSPGPKPRRG